MENDKIPKKTPYIIKWCVAVICDISYLYLYTLDDELQYFKAISKSSHDSNYSIPFVRIYSRFNISSVEHSTAWFNSLILTCTEMKAKEVSNFIYGHILLKYLSQSFSQFFLHWALIKNGLILSRITLRVQLPLSNRNLKSFV